MSINEKFMNLGYEVNEQLGEGGGGSVFKAYHKNLRKNVVIKKIHDRFKDSDTQRSEVDILKNLHHSYIPQVFDYFEIDGIGYTVMDFVPGDSLGNYLKQGKKFTDKQIIKYATQLCEAVAYLHEQKIPIIHGDIKPDNIMLTPDDDICLIDFNISGISSDGTAETSGYTAGYGAPEQYIQLQKIKQQIREMSNHPVEDESASSADDATEIIEDIDEYATEILGDDFTEIPGDDATEILNEDATEILNENGDGKKSEKVVSESRINGATGRKFPMIKIDKRSDVYSIGATIYRLYTGKLVTEGTVTVKSGASDAFINIINKAISTDPSKRYRDAGEMLKALNAIYKQDKSYKRTIFLQNLIRVFLLFTSLAGVGLVYLGMQTKEKEKYNTYDEYVSVMSRISGPEDYDEFEQAYNGAIEIFPERIEPYYYKSSYLYTIGQYEEDIYFIEDEVFTVSGIYEQDGVDVIFSSLAGSYYELGDYRAAANNYASAIKYNDKEAKYYVDYAFALAKDGDTDGAGQQIEEARSRGADQGYVYLAEGELYIMEGRFREAIDDFDLCIQNADSDYTVLRAYLGIADAYEGMAEEASEEDKAGIYAEEVDVLYAAQANVASEYADALREELAIAAIAAAGYDDSGYYEGVAIETLNLIIDKGLASFDTYFSLTNLYLTTEDYDSAGATVIKMEELFPDNYRVYKSGAIVQVQLINEGLVTDYSLFEYYYDNATEKYAEEEFRNDQQMQQLDTIYQELKDRGVL